jgi:hypothetical protein
MGLARRSFLTKPSALTIRFGAMTRIRLVASARWDSAGRRRNFSSAIL